MTGARSQSWHSSRGNFRNSWQIVWTWCQWRGGVRDVECKHDNGVELNFKVIMVYEVAKWGGDRTNSCILLFPCQFLLDTCSLHVSSLHAVRRSALCTTTLWYIHTGWPQKWHHFVRLNFIKILTNFQTCFTARIGREKFVLILSWYFIFHQTCTVIFPIPSLNVSDATDIRSDNREFAAKVSTESIRCGGGRRQHSTNAAHALPVRQLQRRCGGEWSRGLSRVSGNRIHRRDRVPERVDKAT